MSNHFSTGRAGPRNPMSHERILKICYAYRRLHQVYVEGGGRITSELYQTMLDIETEIIRWEQRSSKLRYEARRQAAYRAAKRDLHEGGAHYDTATDTFVGDFSAPLEESPSDVLPAATREAIAKRFGLASPREDDNQVVPDTSNYRKSGLV